MTGHREWKSAGLMRQIDGVSPRGMVKVLGGLTDEDMTALYNLATMSVYPSLYEGFGFPVIESFACGTPAAASNATSIPEAAGDAALLFDPTDTGEIAAALETLLGDEGLRTRMTEKGLRRAAELSWERTAEKVLGVLREVA
jgi:glycosyltransferase involved in cell wall biosynthesis